MAKDNIAKLYKAFSDNVGGFDSEDEFREYIRTADSKKMGWLYKAFDDHVGGFENEDDFKSYVGWTDPADSFDPSAGFAEAEVSAMPENKGAARPVQAPQGPEAAQTQDPVTATPAAQTPTPQAVQDAPDPWVPEGETLPTPEEAEARLADQEARNAARLAAMTNDDSVPTYAKDMMANIDAQVRGFGAKTRLGVASAADTAARHRFGAQATMRPEERARQHFEQRTLDDYKALETFHEGLDEEGRNTDIDAIVEREFREGLPDNKPMGAGYGTMGESMLAMSQNSMQRMQREDYDRILGVVMDKYGGAARSAGMNAYSETLRRIYAGEDISDLVPRDMLVGQDVNGRPISMSSWVGAVDANSDPRFNIDLSGINTNSELARTLDPMGALDKRFQDWYGKLSDEERQALADKRHTELAEAARKKAEDEYKQAIEGQVQQKILELAAPGSDTEYLLNTIVGGNPITKINAGLARRGAGVGETTLQLRDQATAQYAEGRPWLQATGMAGQMLFDPTLYLAAPISGAFAARAVGWFGKAMYGGTAMITTAQAGRYATMTMPWMSRIVGGVAGGAANLGSYELMGNAVDQFRDGRFSVGEMLGAGLHGAKTGAALGVTGSVVGKLGEGVVGKVGNTYAATGKLTTGGVAKKVAADAGFKALGITAETGVFATMGLVDEGEPWTVENIMKHTANAFATVMVLKGQHMVTSGGKAVIDRATGEVPAQSKGIVKDWWKGYTDRLKDNKQMAFTKEDRRWLGAHGYGDLGRLFDVKDEDAEVIRVEDYDRLGALLKDKDVPLEITAKAYYMVTGVQMPMVTPGAVNTIVNRDAEGNVTSYTVEVRGKAEDEGDPASGRLISRREYKSQGAATHASYAATREMQKSQIAEQERNLGIMAMDYAYSAAIEEVAGKYGMSPEGLAQVFVTVRFADPEALKAAYGEDGVSKMRGIAKVIMSRAEKHAAEAERQSHKPIKEGIEKSQLGGGSLDEVMDKWIGDRTDGENTALGDYQRALKQAADDIVARRKAELENTPDLGEYPDHDVWVDAVGSVGHYAHDDGRLVAVKVASGEDERDGYVVRGKVVLNADGTLDRTRSDKELYVADLETGKVEMKTPEHILSVEEEDFDAAVREVYKSKGGKTGAKETGSAERSEETATETPAAAEPTGKAATGFGNGGYGEMEIDGERRAVAIGEVLPADYEEPALAGKREVLFIGEGDETREPLYMTDEELAGKVSNFEPEKTEKQKTEEQAAPVETSVKPVEGAPVETETPVETTTEAAPVETPAVEPPATPVETTATTTTEATPTGDAMPMVEVKKGGKTKQTPDWKTAGAGRSHQHLYQEKGLSKEEADAFVDGRISASEKAVKAAKDWEKKKPEASKYDDPDDYLEAKAEWEAGRDTEGKAEAELKLWQDVKAIETERRSALYEPIRQQEQAYNEAVENAAKEQAQASQEPQTVDEYVAAQLSGLNRKGATGITYESLVNELGESVAKEVRKKLPVGSVKSRANGGVSVAQLADNIWESMPRDIRAGLPDPDDSHYVRNLVIDALRGGEFGSWYKEKRERDVREAQDRVRREFDEGAYREHHTDSFEEYLDYSYMRADETISWGENYDAKSYDEMEGRYYDEMVARLEESKKNTNLADENKTIDNEFGQEHDTAGEGQDHGRGGELLPDARPADGRRVGEGAQRDARGETAHSGDGDGQAGAVPAEAPRGGVASKAADILARVKGENPAQDSGERHSVLGGTEARVAEPRTKQEKALVDLAESFGRKVVFEDGENFHGSNDRGYIDKDGVIHINKDMSLPEQLSFVIGHEFAHTAEESAGYGEMMDAILGSKVFDEWLRDSETNTDELVSDKMQAYKDAGIPLDEQGAKREIVADFVSEKILQDPRNVRRIMAESPTTRGFLTRIADKLLEFFRRLAGRRPLTPREEEMRNIVEMFASNVREANAELNDAARRESIDTMVESIGLTFDMENGRTIFRDKDGNEVSEVSVGMVAESRLGFIIDSSVENGFISKEMGEKEKQFFSDMFNMMLKTQNIDLVWAVSGMIGFQPYDAAKHRDPRMRDTSDKYGRFAAITANSDPQYNKTIDFTTICLKTQAIIDAMSGTMKKLGRGLTEDEIVNVVFRNTHQAGEAVPCPVCYVFSRWVGLGGLFDRIKGLQDKYANVDRKDLLSAFSQIKVQVDAIKKSKGYTRTDKATKELTTAMQTRINVLIEKQTRAKMRGADLTEAETAELASLERDMEILDNYTWFKDVRLNANYKPVPDDVLFDINKGKEFAEEYPLTWKFRTTRGSAMGKAATPYAPEHLGQILAGLSIAKVDSKGTQKITNPGNNKTLNGTLKEAKAQIRNAIEKMRAQNLIGGQRYQSTSDFRFEYGLDYLLSFLEIQAAGGKVQLYTKVPEAVNFLASVGCEVNLSLMPKGVGYKVDANGRPVYGEDGNLILQCSDVTGMNFEDALDARGRWDNVQTIMVAINNEHLLACMRDGRIDFIIPYHSSGASESRLKALMDVVGEHIKNATDYTAWQNDKPLEDASAVQKNAWSARMKILTRAGSFTEAEKQAIRDVKVLYELYKRFNGKTIDGVVEAIDPRYLSPGVEAGVTIDPQCKGVKFTKDVASHIFPYEYWDKTSTRETADENGRAFAEYCDALGMKPRFSGAVVDGKPLTEHPGYWKTLIDRSMYNNDGTYHEPSVIHVDQVNADYLDRAKSSEGMHVPSKVNDPSKTQAIVDRSVADIEGRRHSILGEKGAKALDDREEATTRMDNLDVARKMEREDKDARSIRIATGWERGADGKWRYEVPDEIEAIKGAVSKFEEYRTMWSERNRMRNEGLTLPSVSLTELDRMVMADSGYGLPLASLMDEDNALFKAYPRLQYINLNVVDEPLSTQAGSYGGGVITLNKGNLADIPAESAFIHEIQHAIQHIEGFAEGGNVKTARDYIKKHRDRAVEAIERTLQERIDAAKPAWDEVKRINSLEWNDENWSEREAELAQAESEAKRQDETVERWRKFLDTAKRKAWSEISDEEAQEVYRNIAGEVEARNASTRMNFSEDERRQKLLEETEDVAREDQIFLKNNLGESASVWNKKSQSKSRQDLTTRSEGDKPVRTARTRAGETIEFTRTNPTNTFKALVGGLRENGVKVETDTARTGSRYARYEVDGVGYEVRSSGHTRGGESMTDADKGLEISFYDGKVDMVEIDLSKNDMNAARLRAVMEEVRRLNESGGVDVAALARDGRLFSDTEQGKAYAEISASIDNAVLESAKKTYGENAPKSPKCVYKASNGVEVEYYDGRISADTSEDVRRGLYEAAGYEGSNKRTRRRIVDEAKAVAIEEYKSSEEYGKHQREFAEYKRADAEAREALDKLIERGEPSADDKLYLLGDPAETFEDRRKAAVENRGTVMPGLADKEVKVVNVPRHGYKGDKPLTQAVESAKARYSGKTLSYDNHGQKFEYSITGGSLTYSANHASNSANIGVHVAVMDKLDSVIGESVEVMEHADSRKVGNERNEENGTNPDALMHRFVGAVKIDDTLYRVVTTMKEVKGSSKGKHHTYEVVDIETIEAPDKNLSRASNGSVTQDDSQVRVAKLLKETEIHNKSGEKILEESAKADRERSDDVRPAAIDKATETAKGLNTQVRVVKAADIKGANDAETRRMRNAKGWYNTRTGEVVLVEDNITSVEDAVTTVLHETVAHKGLRGLYGERFDKVLDDIYDNLDAEVRDAIDARVGRQVYDTMFDGPGRVSHEAARREATEEYLASLAEETNFEAMSQRPWFQRAWERIKSAVSGMLMRAGIRLPRKLTDNELRYMLWRSYNNLQRTRDMRVEAENRLKMDELGIGDRRFRDPGDADLPDTELGNAARTMRGAILHANHKAGGDYAGALAQVTNNILKVVKDMRTRRGTDKQWADAEAKAGRAAGKAARAQRTYDRATVQSVSDLARVLLETGYIDSPTQGEMKRLLSVVKNATGVDDLTEAVNKVIDIMVNTQLRRGEKSLDDLLKVKGSKVDARGVEVQGKLDIMGQRRVESMKRGMGMKADAIDEAMVDAMDRMTNGKTRVARDNAADEYAGLWMAKRYHDDIKGSEEAETAMEAEIKRLEEQKADGAIPAGIADASIESLRGAIRRNRVERAGAYDQLAGQLGDMERRSMAAAERFVERQKQHVGDIHHKANSDMEGRSAEIYVKPGKAAKFVNNGLVQGVFAPLATFEQMLRVFGNKAVNGEGYLWNHFARGWVDAREKFLNGRDEKMRMLDQKAADILDKDKARWTDLIELDRKLKPIEVEVWDPGAGAMMPKQLTQGNVMYIYMVNKMADGRMKLAKMGITEDVVDALADKLDPRLRKAADWLQEEFLPQIRDGYNETHKRLFGASMADIDDYFPLVINKRDITTKEADLDKKDLGGISTKTGAITKRVVNTKALDILNANAINVVVDHVYEMEQWNAFADWNNDLNILRTYGRFKNQVMNMTTVYGSGKVLWDKFEDACRLAAGTYEHKRGWGEAAAVNTTKLITASKIGLRTFTAYKQLLSFPAYFPDVSVGPLLRALENPESAIEWCMKNLPLYRERWNSRMAGDPRLVKTDVDWKMWRSKFAQTCSRVGMTPNAFIDAVTVGIGAHAVYRTRYERYLKEGYSMKEADRRAKQDAAIAFNQSQQSSEGMFMSTLQADHTWFSTLVTVFRNASMSYTRQEFDALRNLGRKCFKKDYKKTSIDFMTKQYMRDGAFAVKPMTGEQIPDDVREAMCRRVATRKYYKSWARDAAKLAIFGFGLQYLWNLGPYAAYLLFGDDPEKKKEMERDARLHAMYGSVEGLTLGDVMSGVANNVHQFLADGRDLKSYALDKDIPLVTDVREIWTEICNGDYPQALNDLTNIIGASVTGINPATLEELVYAAIDWNHGDLDAAKESALFLMRVQQVPQSQIDNIYFDEIDLSGREAMSMSPKDLIERYATYKTMREAGPFKLSYSDEKLEKRMDSKRKKVRTLLKDKLANASDDDVNNLYNEGYDIRADYNKAIKAIKDDDSLSEVEKERREYAYYAEHMGDACVANFYMYFNSPLAESVRAFMDAEDPDLAKRIADWNVEYKRLLAQAVDLAKEYKGGGPESYPELNEVRLALVGMVRHKPWKNPPVNPSLELTDEDAGGKYEDKNVNDKYEDYYEDNEDN